MELNEKKIQPIITWVDGQTKTLDAIRFNYYSQYDFKGYPGFVYYSLCETVTETQTDGDGNETTIQTLNPVIHGNVDMTWEIVNNWGQDDSIIFEYVLEKLNLTEVNG